MPTCNEALPDQSGDVGSSRPLTVPDWRRKLNRDKRYALYEEVKALREQSLSHDAIADALGISRPTVRRLPAAEQFPERLSGLKRQRQSIVRPYLPFLPHAKESRNRFLKNPTPSTRHPQHSDLQQVFEEQGRNRRSPGFPARWELSNCLTTPGARPPRIPAFV